jgi:hypothetical protein
MLYILLHSMNNVPNGSRGHPESVAPEFVGRSQLKVKISPPKVGEICRGRIWSHFSYVLVSRFGEMSQRSYLYDQTGWSLTARKVRNTERPRYS